MNIRKKVFASRYFVPALLGLACAITVTFLILRDTGIMKPPIWVAYNVGAIGVKTSLPVRISEAQIYAMQIRFLRGDTPEDSIRVGKLLGYPQMDNTGRWVETGVPGAFQVEIYKQPENKILLSTIVEYPKTRSGFGGRVADLAEMKLEPGDYTISITNRSVAPEIATLPAQLVFLRAYKGK